MTKLDLAPPTWHFVPADLDAGDIAALEPLFAELDARPIADVADLERWLHDESELMSRIGAEIARQLRDRKLGNIEKIAPDAIATGNIGCITQIGSGTAIPIMHTVELLDWVYGGPEPQALKGSGASH